ncbi:serine/threonine protein phosphatase PrpC [Catenulispora sp. GP43]|uniref:PP2C family protein-serine/threonine phosphatase n=1 Tax=Catenulispora sp. GP43 TaxID=3156263 RepID=UPI0035175D4C
MTAVLTAVALTDRGLRREENEDAFHVGAHLLAVADGMGGHVAGGLASATVIAELATADRDGLLADTRGRLRAAILAANSAIARLVSARPEIEGTGTTVTAVVFDGAEFVVGNVGDSRTYLFRDGTLTGLTRDDSFVQMLVDSGQINADDAMRHPFRSLVTQALQGQDDVVPTIAGHPARLGDRLLLCSDGLTDVLGPQELTAALSVRSAHECAHALVDAALTAGGPDNVTVVVADVQPGAAGQPMRNQSQ